MILPAYSFPKIPLFDEISYRFLRLADINAHVQEACMISFKIFVWHYRVRNEKLYEIAEDNECSFSVALLGKDLEGHCNTRPTLGPTQPPVQWVPEFFFVG